MARERDLTAIFFAESDPRSKGWYVQTYESLWDTLIWQSLPDRPIDETCPWFCRACSALCGTAGTVLRRLWLRSGRTSRTSGASPPSAVVDAAWTAYRRPVADLSRHYAGLHRSSFLVMAALGVVAVLCALTIPALDVKDDPHGFSRWQWGLVFAEALLILGMMLIYWLHHHYRWQERAIDYRLIAERLRHAAALAHLGRSPTPFRGAPPQWLALDPRHSWAERYAKNVIRTIGLAPLAPRRLLDQDYLRACREYLAREWIEEQIRYHERNSARAEALHLDLELLAIAALGATLLVCLAHVVAHLPWLYIPAGVLPAFGAACHAVSGQADLQRIAVRSKAMAEKLKDFRDRLLALPANGAFPTALARITEEAADSMLAEAGEWRVLFQTHPLPPPL